MENWVKIYEINEYEIGTTIWLEQLLKDTNIPYKSEIEEYWIGTRFAKYKRRLKIFVLQEHV